MSKKKDIKNFTNKRLYDWVINYIKNPPSNPEEKKDFKKLGNEFIVRDIKVKDYTEKLLDEYLKHGIHEDEALHFYIRCFLGWTIPREARCKKAKHCAPFKFISDLFFERVLNAVLLANRTGGKTLNLAILNHLNMAFKDGCEIASAASTRDQSGKMHEHFSKFHSRTSMSYMGLHLEKIFIPRYKEITKGGAVYTNGSKIDIVTGTEKGLNSPHPNKALIDEVELMKWQYLQQGLSMAITSNNIKAQNVFASTRKRADGTFERLLNVAKESPWPKFPWGFGLYSWCIWEVMEKCVRQCKDDLVYSDCPIEPLCRGKAKGFSGFYVIDDFIIKYMGGMDKDVLESEWLCLKPARRALVYGDYWVRERNLIPAYEEREDKETGAIEIVDLKEKRFNSREIMFISAIDFGTTKSSPFVFLTAAVDVTEFKKEVEEVADTSIIRVKPTFYIVYEYRSAKETMEKHSEKIKASPYYSDDMLIFVDPSASQQILDMEELYGVYVLPANNDVESGIDIVRSHLWVPSGGAPHLFIFDDYLDCDDSDLIGTDMEFDRYRYRLGDDGKPRQGREAILKQDDHGPDCVRYLILTGIEYLKELFSSTWEEVEGDGFWNEE